jgi:hypothetical protein
MEQEAVAELVIARKLEADDTLWQEPVSSLLESNGEIQACTLFKWDLLALIF